MKTVYIISGPIGVGKTTISKALVQKLDSGKVIEGDLILHKIPNRLTWNQKLKATWDKILTETQAYIKQNFDVVIDFIVEEELQRIFQGLSKPETIIKYVVLGEDKNTILKNIKKRGEDNPAIDRSMMLMNKLYGDSQNAKYKLNSTNLTISKIVDDIISADKYIVT